MGLLVMGSGNRGPRRWNQLPLPGVGPLARVI